MKIAVISTSTALILITLVGLAGNEFSFASASLRVGQRRSDASSIQLKSEALSRLQARIQIVSQKISTLQAQITAIETTHHARVGQLQAILDSQQPTNKARNIKTSVLPSHSVGFRRTPIGATLSVNGANMSLAPASLSIKGVQQIVLQGAVVHFRSPLLQFNEGNRPVAGVGDIVAGVLALGPTGIPIPNQYLTGHIVTGSTTILVP
jgi:hypothetical protein